MPCLYLPSFEKARYKVISRLNLCFSQHQTNLTCTSRLFAATKVEWPKRPFRKPTNKSGDRFLSWWSSHSRICLHSCGVNLHVPQSFTCLYFAISYTPSDPQDLPLPYKTILLIIIGLPDFKWLLKALLDGSSNYPSASLKTLSLILSILVKISPLICDLKLPLMFALFYGFLQICGGQL